LKTFEEILEGKTSKLKKALAEWVRYKGELGDNKFALYSTVTHLATHVEVTSGNIVSLKIYKEKVRDKALSSESFKSIGSAVNQ